MRPMLAVGQPGPGNKAQKGEHISSRGQTALREEPRPLLQQLPTLSDMCRPFSPTFLLKSRPWTICGAIVELSRAGATDRHKALKLGPLAKSRANKWVIAHIRAPDSGQDSGSRGVPPLLRPMWNNVGTTLTHVLVENSLAWAKLGSRKSTSAKIGKTRTKFRRI